MASISVIKSGDREKKPFLSDISMNEKVDALQSDCAARHKLNTMISIPVIVLASNQPLKPE
jgi:hypothetical protein